MTFALYIFRTALSLHQYIPKFITAAMAKNRTAPLCPPMYPPSTTNRAVSPAISMKTLVVCIVRPVQVTISDRKYPLGTAVILQYPHSLNTERPPAVRSWI
jgi:hypothetical protein